MERVAPDTGAPGTADETLEVPVTIREPWARATAAISSRRATTTDSGASVSSTCVAVRRKSGSMVATWCSTSARSPGLLP